MLLLITLGTLTAPVPGWAQVDRIEDQLPTPTPPPQQPDLTLPPGEELTPPENAEELKFELKSLEIEGATVYTQEELRPFFVAFLGKSVSLKDLYEIANAITQLYRKDGYLLSLAVVPEQTVRDGVARIQVIEGYIDRVDFEGAPTRQIKRLQGFADKITASRPLNVKALERYLLLANDLAGFEVRAILRRGEQLGTANLLARVIYDPFEPFADLTNRGTEEVGPLRLQAGAFLNSLAGQGEQWTLRAATAPIDPRELALGSVGVAIPVGSEGLQFDVNGSFTGVETGGELRAFDIDGRTITAGVGVSYPIVRSRSTNFFVDGGFDYADSRNTIGFTGTEEVLNQDRLQVLRAGVALETIDAQGGFTASARLSQGVGGTTPDNATEPLSRAEGSAIFTKVNLNLSRRQRLPGAFTLLFAATGQITGDTMLVRESFGLGNPTFGSAFEPDEALGDQGYGLRLELQRTLIYRALGFTMSTQPYIYGDYGQVFRNSPTLAETGSDTLSSAGFGVRQTIGERVSASLEFGFPIENTVPVSGSEPRIFFTITGFF